MKKTLVAVGLSVIPFLASAATDPTEQLVGIIETDWPLVLAAGVTVMIGTIAMAVIKKFRRVM